MNRLFLTLCCALMLAGAKAQVALDSTRRAPEYVQNIVARSGKIVNLLGLSNDDAKRNVLNVIANRYFLLNDLYAKYASDRHLRPNSTSIISNLRLHWLIISQTGKSKP